MSQPKRYYLDDYGVLIEHPNGEYLLHSDYAALAADRTKWINLSVEHEKEVAELQGKNAALAAENERLRKAGDEMMEVLESEIPFTAMNAVNGWLAAKEGGDAK